MRTPLSVALIALFAASAAADEVNVYSSRHYNTDQALYDGNCSPPPFVWSEYDVAERCRGS